MIESKLAFADSFTGSSGGSTLRRWRKFLPETVYWLNQHPKSGGTSPIGRTDGSRMRRQGWQWKHSLSPLITPWGDEGFLPSLCYPRMASMSLLQRDKRHNKGSVGPEAKISPESLWIPPACESTGGKGRYRAGWEAGSWHPWETGWLLWQGVRKGVSGTQESPGVYLSDPRPVATVNGEPGQRRRAGV